MTSSHSSFSIGEAVSFGWRSVTKNLKFFLPIVLIVTGAVVVFQLFNGILQRSDARVFMFILVFAYMFLQLLMALGVIKIAIDFVRKKHDKLDVLFSQSRLVPRYFLATILAAIPVWIVGGIGFGGIILIVLGFLGDVSAFVPLVIGLVTFAFIVYWQTKMQFYSYFMVDKNTGVVESLKKSFKATNGHFWRLVGLGIVLALVNLLGALALVIGLLVTIPIDWVARAYVYNSLVKSEK